MREGVFTFSPLPVLSIKAAFPPFASMYVNVCVGIFFRRKQKLRDGKCRTAASV